jgi:hypothetical protein
VCVCVYVCVCAQVCPCCFFLHAAWMHAAFVRACLHGNQSTSVWALCFPLGSKGYKEAEPHTFGEVGKPLKLHCLFIKQPGICSLTIIKQLNLRRWPKQVMHADFNHKWIQPGLIKPSTAVNLKLIANWFKWRSTVWFNQQKVPSPNWCNGLN